MSLAAKVHSRFLHWALRGRVPEATPVLLTRQRIYVLPTRFGLAYCLMLVVMLIAAINYELSMAYSLVFLLAGLGVVCIFHSFRNLAQLSIAPGKIPPSFAGEAARYTLRLDHPGGRARPALRLSLPGQPEVVVDVPADEGAEVTLTQPTLVRGWLAMPRLRLASIYPLGLIRAWAYAAPAMRCLVYPAPHAEVPPTAAAPDAQGAAAGRSAGLEDFSGLRQHHPADPLRHVAWKAAARSEQGPLLTKQFDGGQSRTLWLDFDALPPDTDLETRLSLLCRGVCEADAAGVQWGLRLPGRSFDPASGDAHRAACLAALALYGLDP